MNLDIGFFIDWFSGSIFILFALTALMYFFSGGKKVLKNTFLMIATVFVWIQFQELSGFIIMGAMFLGLNYILKLVLLKFAETTPSLSNKMALINEVSFIFLLVGCALFVGF
ncbi:MAG: hypothetical protein JW703_01220 [Candidatus Diapherotrites archaeon]|nr:hypothetical protein [Candidatus Diapherotrites archaeon]